MNRCILLGGSIGATALIVLASMTTIVGYQTVQASNKKIITAEINQKELLFQTIAAMMNNKEIQRIILPPERTGTTLVDPGTDFSVLTSRVNIEQVLKRVYSIGVVLTRTMSATKRQSLARHGLEENQGLITKIRTVVAKDETLTRALQTVSTCDCDQSGWYPGEIFCLMLEIMMIPVEVVLFAVQLLLHYPGKLVQVAGGFLFAFFMMLYLPLLMIDLIICVGPYEP